MVKSEWEKVKSERRSWRGWLNQSEERERMLKSERRSGRGWLNQSGGWLNQSGGAGEDG